MTGGILALAYGHRTEIKSVAPIARELQRSGIPCHFVVPNKLAGIAKSESLSFEIFRRDPEAALAYQASCESWIQDLFSTLPRSLELTASGFPNKLLSPWLRRRLTAETLTNAISYYIYAKGAIERHAPRAVLLINSWTLEGYLSRLAAAEYGIRTIVIPTYFTQLSFLSRVLLSEQTDHFPDRWGVLGKHMCTVLTDLGVHRNTIGEINFPKFSKVTTTEATGKTLLLVLQNFPEDRFVIDQVLNAFDECPDCTLIIRPHPISDSWLGFRRSLRIRRNHRITVDTTTPFEYLLERSAIVISVSSVGCYEAILRNRSVIMLNTISRPLSYIFKEYGAVIELTDPRLLPSTIESIFEDRLVQEHLKIGRKKVIEDFIPKEKRSAVEVLLDLIESGDDIRPIAAGECQ